ncbi:MAG: GAF domain-containing protein [Neisseria sp.]|nr:GAF domain-containing protein [Neisseria sp.]
MSLVLEQDYLRTQGLRLSAETVRMAHLAARAVMDLGQAEIDREVLWAFEGADYLCRSEENGRALKQVFMALDTACERVRLQTAAVYVLNPEHEVLFCIVRRGLPIETVLPVSDIAEEQFLAVRTAKTGWLNLIDDVAAWNDMPSAALRCGGVMSLPVCLESGRVLGVLHVEAERAGMFDEESQALWVGLALALTEPLKVLSGVGEQSGDDE